ncbi:hypothetical protein [Branchiibius sp. NY16-3462-2]|uniref:hypothetical protein n=1 Tax=Branchiibius sp. NY16-3462-2 TaxID=1807500 RepID=UPI0007950BD7|nr:hypothetical protein [Branchiibius sp. NY16-3462-2]KYH45147.1 hypothetical protein AZH51_14800 [Branchiibius sp. NY16-3462-2]
MPNLPDRRLRLESAPDGNWEDAVAQRVHDPLWFLARQWQLGEFQGENASTPVQVTAQVSKADITYTLGAADPGQVPAEPLVEMGAPDGLPDPTKLGSTWDPRQLRYDRKDVFRSDATSFDVRRHNGDHVDWYTVDANSAEPPHPGPPEPVVRLPVRLDFANKPPQGIWEIEDADADLSAIPPDSAHPSTAIAVDLLNGSHDEWFVFQVPGLAGSVLSVEGAEVLDSMGDTYDDGDVGLQPPQDWTLFLTEGLAAHQLLLWNIAEFPLMSEPIERVQFGVDEAANLVWAVERRIGSRDATEVNPVPAPEPPEPGGDLTGAQSYLYVPGEGAAAHWIPYSLDEDKAAPDHAFVQRRLLDLSTPPTPMPMPRPMAQVLLPDEVHRVLSSAIPQDGIELERRYLLARDIHGQPQLWIQQQIRPLLSPPARALAFDVARPLGHTSA